MSDNTEYQPVPTTIERTDATRCRCSVSGPLICFGFILIIAGVPGILIGALKYDRANSFNTQPGLCRVNAIGTERIGTMKTSANYPLWNVDIVKQADSSDATKNFTVLRSSVLIQGTDGFKFAQRALEDAKALYSVGKVYHCYYRKNALNLPVSNHRKATEKNTVLWEKPSRTVSIVLLSIGVAPVAIGILLLIICFTLYR